jgi:hypothetical protein
MTFIHADKGRDPPPPPRRTTTHADNAELLQEKEPEGAIVRIEEQWRAKEYQALGMVACGICVVRQENCPYSWVYIRRLSNDFSSYVGRTEVRI